jgi:hypothetical protein
MSVATWIPQCGSNAEHHVALEQENARHMERLEELCGLTDTSWSIELAAEMDRHFHDTARIVAAARHSACSRT